MNTAFLDKMLKSIGLFFTFTLIFFPVAWTSADAKDWTVTVYGAIQARSDFDEMFHDPDFDNDYKFIAVALNRRIGSFTKHLDFEGEVQVVKHFDGQSHMEFNGLLIARWLTFPWDEYLDTSLAIGDGLSWASETPKLEALEHEKTSALLDYVLVEASFSLPQAPEWSLVWRIHHRSGVFGLFNGVHGGSNAMGVGVSYHF